MDVNGTGNQHKWAPYSDGHNEASTHGMTHTRLEAGNRRLAQPPRPLAWLSLRDRGTHGIHRGVLPPPPLE